MTEKDRREELLKLIEGTGDARGVIEPMVDDVVFLEERLRELRALPFIRINPADPSQQKPTQAAKQYKELMQQYTQCVKIITGAMRRADGEEESPLREFFRTFEEEE